MRLPTRLATVAAATAALVATTAPGASAGTPASVYSARSTQAACGETLGHASAYFQDNGEIVTLTDQSRDGHSVRASLWANGSFVDEISNTGGYQHTETRNYSIGEGADIKLAVWVNVGGRACGYRYAVGVA